MSCTCKDMNAQKMKRQLSFKFREKTTTTQNIEQSIKTIIYHRNRTKGNKTTDMIELYIKQKYLSEKDEIK